MKITIITIYLLVSMLLFSPVITLSAAEARPDIEVGREYLRRRMVSMEPFWDLVRYQLGYPREAERWRPRCGQIRVAWEEASRAEHYELYRDGDLVYKGPDTSVLDSDLIYGKNYNYHIRAVNPGGAELSETQRFQAVTRCVPQYAPRQVEIQPMECGGHLSFSWDPVAEADFYRVEEGDGVERRGVFFGSAPWAGRLQDDEERARGDGDSVYEGTQRMVRKFDLEPGREYTYTIWAGNETGYSQEGRQVKVTASKQCPPDSPQPPRSW